MMSSTILANDTLDNIEKTDEGFLFTEDQVIELANYIEELEAENEKLEKKLEQAEKEIDKAYENEESIFDMRRFNDYLSGAGVASLLILIANGLGGS